MLRKYLNAVVIGLLLAAWLAVGTHSYLRVSKTAHLARSVSNGTSAFREYLLQPKETFLPARTFPKDRVVRTIKSAWSTAPAPGAYPREILARPRSAPAARARGR